MAAVIARRSGPPHIDPRPVLCPATLDICPRSGRPDDMTDKSTTRPPDGPLEPIRASRNALEMAATSLERSLAAPSATPQWRESVIAALDRSSAALDAHIEATSAPTGLSSSVIRAAPRLAGQAGRLSEEHAELLDRQRALTSLAHDKTCSPDELRDAAARQSTLLLRHVRRAHDLLHDAIESELGGSD